jgi:hypothetical protein
MSENIAAQLKGATVKLNYLLGLCDESDTNNHRQAILKKYMRDITDEIKEVIEKMDEAYTNVNMCEESEDTDKSYSELFDKLRIQVIKDNDFMHDFAPIMTMWFMLTL